MEPQRENEETIYATQLNSGCSDFPPEPPTSTKAVYTGYPHPFRPTSYDPSELNVCPYASTRIMVHKERGTYLVSGITCKRWGCAPCGRQKIRDLAWWTKLACPNKLLTLTVDPKAHDNPELAWLSTAPKVPELVRSLRKKWGVIEYLRVVELTDKGWPHYHLMVRAAYIPQLVIRKCWEDLTAAKIVDIREVKQFFNSFQYLVKYLTKLKRVDWTERHVTYSRKFFPVPISADPDAQTWKQLRTIDAHPLEYIAANYNHGELIATGPLRFESAEEPPYWCKPEAKPKPLVERQTNWIF